MTRPARLRAAVAAACAAAAAFLAATAAVPAQAQVTIGAAAPLTGPRAQLGRYYKQGVELALVEINEAGGVLGKPLAVAFEDDQGDNPNVAMNAVNRLMQVHKVPVILGPHYSVAQMATQKAYCNGNVVSITGASGIPVTNSGCKYVVRVRGDDAIQSKALVQFAAKELKADKIGVLYVNDDFGKTGAQRVAAAIEAQGLKPVAMETHNPQDKDFSAPLARLKAANAQVVVLWTHIAEAALVVRQARQMGLTMHFAGTAMSQPTFLNLAEAMSEGVLSADDFVADNPDPNIQRFVRKYQAKYGAAPEIWAAAYYDATHLAAKAVNAAGSADPQKIRAAFGSVQHTGVLASFRCSDNGDCNHQIHIVEIRNKTPGVRTTVKF
jgi:branched-chain amino acid transport system substrate-binding protein